MFEVLRKIAFGSVGVLSIGRGIGGNVWWTRYSNMVAPFVEYRFGYLYAGLLGGT